MPVKHISMNILYWWSDGLTSVWICVKSVLTVVSKVYVQRPLCNRAVQSSVGGCQWHRGGQRVPSSAVSSPVTPEWPLLSNYSCHSVTSLCPYPNNIIAMTMDTLMLLITVCPPDNPPPHFSFRSPPHLCKPLCCVSSQQLPCSVFA